MQSPALGRIEKVNKELWLVLSLFAIALLFNHILASQRMVLSLYALPTLGSAYFYGRRHAACLDLNEDRIEDVRAAALLHDIGKLDISRELLYKAARLTHEEYEEIQNHVPRGIHLLESVGGSLRRVIPIILAHHD